MEAVSYVAEWVIWLSVLIFSVSITMVTYQAFRKIHSLNESDISDCNKKIKNTLIGAAVALSLTGLIAVIKDFY